MTHAGFVHAYRAGDIRVSIDRAAAARYLSARLLLPFFMLPVLGMGVALALLGWVWTGLGIILIATLAPMLIKRSAPHFIITQALQDATFYEDVRANGLLEIVLTAEERQAG
jgi:hypothetical protein